MVVTTHPSACAASTVHDFTDSPSSRTVHAPHDVESHPMLVPVSPTTSRRYWTRRVRDSTSCSVEAPLTVIATGTSGVGAAMRATLPGTFRVRIRDLPWLRDAIARRCCSRAADCAFAGAHATPIARSLALTRRE